jgi:hypothetical protein
MSAVITRNTTSLCRDEQFALNTNTFGAPQSGRHYRQMRASPPARAADYVRLQDGDGRVTNMDILQGWWEGRRSLHFPE